MITLEHIMFKGAQGSGKASPAFLLGGFRVADGLESGRLRREQRVA
jgi:hypothetical protein